MRSDWTEIVADAARDAECSMTPEQAETIASYLEGSIEIHCENRGMASGHDAIPNPLEAETKRLKRQLQAEKDKVTCRQCDGHGAITTIFPGTSRSSTSQCWKCRGEGRHAP